LKYAVTFFVWVSFVLLPSNLRAQETGNDDPLVTTSIGVPLTVPLSPISHQLAGAWGVSSEVGYNFDRKNALIGEFMWNSLYPTDEALQPIRVALQSSRVNGHGNLFAVTSEYRFELRGRRLGAYFIGGGGWYYRNASLSKPIPTGTTITCDPSWRFWGFTCTAGLVTNDETIASSSTSAFGANGGIGFTIRVGDAPYRFFAESRYHFAPTKNVTTQLIVVTVGIRY
jgi:hypothetical protein